MINGTRHAATPRSSTLLLTLNCTSKTAATAISLAKMEKKKSPAPRPPRLTVFNRSHSRQVNRPVDSSCKQHHTSSSHFQDRQADICSTPGGRRGTAFIKGATRGYNLALAKGNRIPLIVANDGGHMVTGRRTNRACSQLTHSRCSQEFEVRNPPARPPSLSPPLLSASLASFVLVTSGRASAD